MRRPPVGQYFVESEAAALTNQNIEYSKRFKLHFRHPVRLAFCFPYHYCNPSFSKIWAYQWTCFTGCYWVQPPCAFAARPSAHARNETNGAVPCCYCSSSGKRVCRRWSKIECGGKSLDAVMMRRSRWIAIICPVFRFPDFHTRVNLYALLPWVGSRASTMGVPTIKQSYMQQNKNRWFEGTAISFVNVWQKSSIIYLHSIFWFKVWFLAGL